MHRQEVGHWGSMHKTKVVPPESHAQGSCGALRGREAADPVDYKHPYPSMALYNAELLALRFDAKAMLRALTARCACCTSTSSAILPPWRNRICATTCFTSSSRSTGTPRSARRWPARSSSLSSCSSAPAAGPLRNPHQGSRLPSRRPHASAGA